MPLPLCKSILCASELAPDFIFLLPTLGVPAVFSLIAWVVWRFFRRASWLAHWEQLEQAHVKRMKGKALRRDMRAQGRRASTPTSERHSSEPKRSKTGEIQQHDTVPTFHLLPDIPPVAGDSSLSLLLHPLQHAPNHTSRTTLSRFGSAEELPVAPVERVLTPRRQREARLPYRHTIAQETYRELLFPALASESRMRSVSTGSLSSAWLDRRHAERNGESMLQSFPRATPTIFGETTSDSSSTARLLSPTPHPYAMAAHHGRDFDLKQLEEGASFVQTLARADQASTAVALPLRRPDGLPQAASQLSVPISRPGSSYRTRMRETTSNAGASAGSASASASGSETMLQVKGVTVVDSLAGDLDKLGLAANADSQLHLDPKERDRFLKNRQAHNGARWGWTCTATDAYKKRVTSFSSSATTEDTGAKHKMNRGQFWDRVSQPAPCGSGRMDGTRLESSSTRRQEKQGALLEAAGIGPSGPYWR